MPLKNLQDRLDTVWDEILDGDYGGLDSGTDDEFSLLGRAFQFSARGVVVAPNTMSYSGIFVRDNGQRGILPESYAQDISSRYKDGDEVSVLLVGQCTYAIAAAPIRAGTYLSAGSSGAWVEFGDYPGGQSVRNGLNEERRRGLIAYARTGAAAAGDKFTIVLY